MKEKLNEQKKVVEGVAGETIRVVSSASIDGLPIKIENFELNRNLDRNHIRKLLNQSVSLLMADNNIIAWNVEDR